MKDREILEGICPICGKSYRGVPAISRADNATPICPDCGIREALASIGVSEAEQEAILQIINDHGGPS